MNMNMFSQTARSPKKILIVTGDCPSHPYACAKLATVLADSGHDVTLAGPNGQALSRLQAEAKRYHESTSTKSKILCISIGDVSTVVHCNVRPVINPKEYSPLQIICNTLFNPKYNPFAIADLFESVMDDQVGTYDSLKRNIPDYELVYAVHSCAATVCDAIESIEQDSPSVNVPPCIVFSSLPYEHSFIYKGLWKMPRSLVALPHVARYSSPSKVLKETRGFVRGIVLYLIQLFWMWLDTYHADRAWKRAGKRNDKRRAQRGLPPVYEGNRYYWRSYPVLSLGGIEPYVADDHIIADNVTVVGSIKSTTTSDLNRLHDWIIRVDKIIYASFGTGTQLSVIEANNLAKLALSLEGTRYSLLLSLQKNEQERLRGVFDEVMGSKARHHGIGILEYHGGKFRIDNDVPQENLLLSSKVEVFVSHMGMGAFIEGVSGGVRFVSYPSGCDQWFNQERVNDAGVALRANPKLQDLDVTVFEAIGNESMKERSRQLALKAANFDSTQVILAQADAVVCGETDLDNVSL